MALARDEAASLDLAVVEESIAEFGFVLPVMEAADDVGPPDVAELEGHQHLVVYLGDEMRAAVRPGAQLGDASPIRLVVVVKPGKLELDARRVVGVVVVGDERHHHAVDGRAAGGRVAV